MLSIDPVDRSSRTNTWCPCASSASARCDPTKPAPPVSSVLIRSCGGTPSPPLPPYAFARGAPDAQLRSRGSFARLVRSHRVRQNCFRRALCGLAVRDQRVFLRERVAGGSDSPPDLRIIQERLQL